MYSLLRPLLFRLSGEGSHDLTLAALRAGAGRLWPGSVPDAPCEVMGLEFPNPVGLAAGLDKSGDCIDGLANLGFGFIEVGTVTPRPQEGNPRPRLFRIPGARALVNRMGFNNQGLDYLMRAVEHSHYQGVLGINVGKNYDTPLENALDDYMTCMEQVHTLASYVVVNLSSPNTPGLRQLQHGDMLRALLEPLRRRQTELDRDGGRKVPLVIKVSPDSTEEELGLMAGILREFEVDGVTVGNTTVTRPESVSGLAHAEEEGGLSGEPLKPLADRALEVRAEELEGRIPLIGLGGIMGAEDALDKRRLGASLVQVYTGLVYRGPGLVGEIARAWPRDGAAGQPEAG